MFHTAIGGNHTRSGDRLLQAIRNSDIAAQQNGEVIRSHALPYRETLSQGKAETLQTAAILIFRPDGIMTAPSGDLPTGLQPL